MSRTRRIPAAGGSSAARKQTGGAAREEKMGARGSKNSQGTEVVQAAMQKDAAAVNRLLEAGCAPDAGDAEGNSAMGAACFSGARDIVELLIKAKGNLEHRNTIGTTPLWYAMLPCTDHTPLIVGNTSAQH